MAKKERMDLATKRLEKLVGKGLASCVADDYETDGKIYYSDRSPLGGMLYWADDLGGMPKEVDDKIKEVEKNDGTVYHITHEHLNFGECWDLWVITDEDLEFGEEDFDNGYTFAYVYNATAPEYSEYGSIGYSIKGGGAVRTA